MTTKVLIVDDNELYRTAFRRNLMLQNYDVVEAENADEALQMFETEAPDLVVTDLSMRSPTEGLDLIRSIKQIDPLTPLVMISAVGTFEEGSVARELGADRVITKQKIDEHIEELYNAIEQARANSAKNREIRAEVGDLTKDPDNIPQGAAEKLRRIISTPNTHPAILEDAYDALIQATAADTRRQLEDAVAGAADVTIIQIEEQLKERLPEFSRFASDTQKELRTAEYFYQRQGGDSPGDAEDFTRNIGFSYCFAVENEAKDRLRRKLNRFLSDRRNIKLIKSLIDPRTRQLDIFYHQHLLRLPQQFDFTTDNVRQVFQRIIEHESHYKPDGLKALGIMIVCFGRDYTVKGLKGSHKIENPLGIKSFDTEEQTLHFAKHLVSLQHFRNPYIHPEISEMEKVSRIRETALTCLEDISRIV